jgi:hypothetical protein
MRPTEYETEIIQLRERLEEMKLALQAMKTEHRKTWLTLVRIYKLTAQEAKLLACMLDGKIKTYDQLCNALESEAFSEKNLCNVVLHRVRGKLPWLKITPVLRIGKQLSADSAARIQADLEKHK